MHTGMIDLRYVEPLVVDDSDFMRKVVKLALRAIGVPPDSIREAVDGKEALAVLNTRNADFAIIDYMMRPLDGIEFIQALRRDASHRSRDLPIIMLSAYTEHHIVAMARDAGVTEFIAKPVSILSLYSRIEEIVTRPRPFVETGKFFGPDRRRHYDENYTGRRRRVEDRALDAGDFAGSELPGRLQ